MNEAGGVRVALSLRSGRWRERWAELRDALLASPRFQRRASDFPLTRPIAKRRARALFDLCAGFVYSQVLAACVRLRLFDALADGPVAADALARRFDLPLDAMERLLAAAAALDLVERRGAGHYGLGSLGAVMVGNEGLAALVEHHALLYADLADPVALLRGRRGSGALARFWAYAGAGQPDALGADATGSYTTLMARSQTLVTEDVLDALPLRHARCLLDVGGGDGTFAAAAALRHSALRVMTFDLPAVAERARQRFAARGLGDRVRAVGGDFHTTPLPGGADVVTLVRVLHDHDDAAAAALLARVHAALAPGGTIAIAEPMAATPGAEAMGDAYFGFYLLAMGSGRPRTREALQQLLADAGFAGAQERRTRRPLQVRVVTARRSLHRSGAEV